jgi:hypothetical protein
MLEIINRKVELFTFNTTCKSFRPFLSHFLQLIKKSDSAFFDTPSFNISQPFLSSNSTYSILCIIEEGRAASKSPH